MTAKIKAPSLPAHLDETQDFRPAWEEAVYSESEITGWYFKDLELQAEDLTRTHLFRRYLGKLPPLRLPAG